MLLLFAWFVPHRYQESKDRDWRLTQLEQAQKREQIRRDIADARMSQREEKQKRISEQATQEKIEYIRVLGNEHGGEWVCVCVCVMLRVTYAYDVACMLTLCV